MLKQNYLNVFENKGGKITIAYASCDEDCALSIGEVAHMEIDIDDLHLLGWALLGLADAIDSES